MSVNTRTISLFLLSGVLILAHHLPEDEKQRLNDIHKSCQSNPATRANEDMLKHLSENIKDPQIGAHMLCVSVKAGLQHENGDLDRAVIRNKVALVTHDQSKVDGLVEKCAVIKETAKLTAASIWSCFADNEVHYTYDV